MPAGGACGWAAVDRSITVRGSKTTTSALIPGCSRPRSDSPSLRAGIPVIFRIAVASGTSLSSLT
jgi:hypothetical protein